VYISSARPVDGTQSGAIVPESRVAERTEGYEARRIHTLTLRAFCIVPALRARPHAMGAAGCRFGLNTLILHVRHPIPSDAFLLLQRGDIIPGLPLSREMKEFLKHFYHGRMVHFSLGYSFFLLDQDPPPV